jgi:hypothetical protein
MAFEALSVDMNSVVYGGLWFDPDGLEYVEVIDLDSSSGVAGSNLVTRGRAYIDVETIRKGSEAWGMVENVDEIVARSKPWLFGRTEFRAMNDAGKSAVLTAAEATFHYMGMDGGPEESRLVIDADASETIANAEKVAEEWRVFDDPLVADDTDGAVWSVLREWGVPEPGKPGRSARSRRGLFPR